MKYYSAIQSTEVLIRAATGMNLEYITLVERSGKTTYGVTPLYEMPRIGTYIEPEARLVTAWSWRVGGTGR